MNRYRPPCFSLQIITLLLWCCLATIGRAETAAQPQPIRFAPLPMENRESIVLQFRPMATFLEQRLGRPVVFDFSDSYATILEKFQTNSIDLAYLGPLPYVELRAKNSQAEPLVLFREESGQPMYTCAIVGLAEPPITLKALNNRHIALTQPLSTCGYLAVNGLLQEQGGSLENNRYRYLDKHDAVALAVIRGEFDAGGLKTSIAKRYSHLGLQVIAETPPFPGFGLIGNRRTLDDATLQAIRTALTSLDPSGADQALLTQWGASIRHGAVAGTDADYQALRRYRGKLTIPTSNKE